MNTITFTAHGAWCDACGAQLGQEEIDFECCGCCGGEGIDDGCDEDDDGTSRASRWGAATMTDVSLSRQLAELRRERRMRDQVYPRLVAKREMKQAEADYLNESLDAAIATLEWLERHRELVLRVRAETKASADAAGSTSA